MATPAPPPLSFSATPAESFGARMDRLGNACFACGSSNAHGARRCRACQEPLPSGVPLPVSDALRISTKSYALRASLTKRMYLSLALVLGGLAISVASQTVASGTAVAGWAFLASVGLAVVGILLFVLTQGRIGRMLRVQVALFKRQYHERRVVQQSIGPGPNPTPTVPLVLDGAAPSLPLAVSVTLGGAPLLTGRWSTVFGGASSAPVHLRRDLKIRGEGGVRWKLQDPRGRVLATVQIDRLLNRVFQLSVNDPTLMREYWLIRDGSGAVLGRFISESRVDDRAGRGLQRLGFYDTDGALILRLEGGYSTIARSLPVLVGAYQGLKAVEGSDLTTPSLQVAPGYEEGAFRLQDPSGRTASEARRARKGDDAHWVVTIAPGARPAPALLASFAVVEWHPDGSNFQIARMLSTNPELAARVEAELRGISP